MRDPAPSRPAITFEELRLAARNHGLPLEALRYPITPTGLHYLLIHYDIPEVDPAAWRLILGGSVKRDLALGLDELRARPAVTVAVTLECAGNGRALLEPRPLSQPWVTEAVGTSEWTGTPLRPLLLEAGVLAPAVEVVFRGLDRGVEGGVPQSYERSLPLADSLRDEVMLAWAMNGQPLPPQHGFPLRLIVPGWYGMTHVKWLDRITVVDRPFAGYQNQSAYRLMRSEEDLPGEPVARMLPRALLIPPGVPDFMTRRRFLPAGPCALEGRAWSGFGPIARVEVSLDGGRSWQEATVGEAPSPYAWHPWRAEWDASPGEHWLRARATDAAGHTQPSEPRWNVKGYANNQMDPVAVTVT